MSTKIEYKYCKVCNREVEEPSRKPLTTSQKILWGIACVGTLGIAYIGYVLYYSNKPKNYCPECHTKIVKSDQPFEKPKKKPEEMTPKERILDKAGIGEEEAEEEPAKPREKKLEEDKIFCPFCGEELEEKVPTCTYCQAVIEW
jgi:hypothetical protein